MGGSSDTDSRPALEALDSFNSWIGVMEPGLLRDGSLDHIADLEVFIRDEVVSAHEVEGVRLRRSGYGGPRTRRVREGQC